MRLLLRDIPAHADVPKEYELDLNPMSNGTSRSNEITKNTFVFSEQDLPGFKAKNKARAAATAAGIPAHLLRQKEKVEKPGQNQNQNQNHHGHGRRGRQEYFRKGYTEFVFGSTSAWQRLRVLTGPAEDHAVRPHQARTKLCARLGIPSRTT